MRLLRRLTSLTILAGCAGASGIEGSDPAPPPDAGRIAQAVRELGNDAPESRDNAFRLLLGWGAEHPEVILPALPCDHNDPEIRYRCEKLRDRLEADWFREAYAAAGPSRPLREALDKLFDAPQGEEEERMKVLIEKAVAKRSYHRMLGRVLAHLAGHPRPSFRRALVETIDDVDGTIWPESAVPALLHLLEDPHSEIALEAMDALADSGAREAAPQIAALLESLDTESRRKACLALTSLEAVPFVDAVAKRLEDPSPAVRIAALESIAALRTDRAEQAAVKLLESTDENVRIAGISMLANLGARNRIPAIAGLLQVFGLKINEAAGASLWRLTGVVFPMDRAGADAAKEWEAAHRTDPPLSPREIPSQEAADAFFMHATDPEHIHTDALQTILWDKRAPKEIVAELSRRLSTNKDPNRRREAALLLAQCKGAQEAEALNQLLEDPEPSVRHATLQAVQHLGRRETVEKVRRLLEDKDPTTRVMAIQTLSAFDDAAAAPRLLQFLDSGVAAHDLEPFDAAYHGYFQDAPFHAMSALNVMAEHDPDLAITLLEHPREEVRKSVRDHLTSRSGKPAAEMTRPILAHFAKRLDDTRPETRANALKVLGALGGNPEIPRIRELLQDPKVADDAIDALSSLKDRSVIPHLVRWLSCGDPDRRSGALWPLHSLGDPDLVEHIAVALKDDASGVRATALFVAVALGVAATELAPEIEKILDSGDEYFVGSAIDAIGNMRHEPASGKIAAFLKSEAHRGEAIRALGKLGDPRYAEQVACFLDTCPWDRDIYRTLVLMKSSAAVPRLAAHLEHPDPAVRIYASQALGEIGDRAALAPLLERMWEEDNTQCAIYAARAIGRLSGCREDAAVRLGKRIDDPDLKTRVFSACALSFCGHPGEIRRVTDLLKSHDPVQWDLAFWSLQALRNRRLIPVFAEILEGRIQIPAALQKGEAGQKVRGEAAVALLEATGTWDYPPGRLDLMTERTWCCFWSPNRGTVNEALRWWNKHKNDPEFDGSNPPDNR